VLSLLVLVLNCQAVHINQVDEHRVRRSVLCSRKGMWRYTSDARGRMLPGTARQPQDFYIPSCFKNWSWQWQDHLTATNCRWQQLLPFWKAPSVRYAYLE